MLGGEVGWEAQLSVGVLRLGGGSAWCWWGEVGWGAQLVLRSEGLGGRGGLTLCWVTKVVRLGGGSAQRRGLLAAQLVPGW